MIVFQLENDRFSVKLRTRSTSSFLVSTSVCRIFCVVQDKLIIHQGASAHSASNATANKTAFIFFAIRYQARELFVWKCGGRQLRRECASF